jgi:pilus assembly protein CpaE
MESRVALDPIVVLLICADRESAARLAAAIQPRGHRVVAAPFGPIALDKAPGAQLIVMDRVDGTADAVGAVQRIKGTPALAALPLLAIAQGDDAEERIRLLEAGADDVVSRPVDPVELRLRIDTLLVRVPEATVVEPTPASVVAERIRLGPKVVAFVSPKGGAGTTTLAVNVATTLARGGRSVCVIDLDLSFGAVAMLLDLRPRFSVVDAVGDDAALEDPTVLQGYADMKESLAVFSAPLRPGQSELVDRDSVRRLLAVAAAGYDTTIVDAGSGFDEVTLAVLGIADRVAIVATPEIPALRAVRTFVEALDERDGHGDRRTYVLNHLFPSDMLTRGDVRRALGDVALLEIPHDPVVYHQAINTGIPVVIDSPRSAAAERLVRLAAALMGDAEGETTESAKKLRLAGLLRRG